MRWLAVIVAIWGLSGAVWAQEAPRIVVQGSGEATAPPEVAFLTLGISHVDVDAESAMAEVSARLEDVFATLSKEGVRSEEVKTSGLRLRPERDATNRSVFRAYSQLEVQVFDVAALGRIISRTVAEGANELGAWDTGLQFDVLDRGSLEAEAQREAVSDALAQARLLAEAAGVSLGPIREIRQGSDGSGVGLARASLSEVPVVPGDVRVRSSVTIVFDLLN